MVKRFQPDNSVSAVLDTVARMQQKETESYRAFVNRLSGVAKRSDPPLPKKEVCRALLKALPVSISSLIIGKGYTTVTEFIEIMEDILTDINLIERKGATVKNKVLTTLGASDKLAEKLEKVNRCQTSYNRLAASPKWCRRFCTNLDSSAARSGHQSLLRRPGRNRRPAQLAPPHAPDHHCGAGPLCRALPACLRGGRDLVQV